MNIEEILAKQNAALKPLAEVEEAMPTPVGGSDFKYLGFSGPDIVKIGERTICKIGTVTERHDGIGEFSYPGAVEVTGATMALTEMGAGEQVRLGRTRFDELKANNPDLEEEWLLNTDMAIVMTNVFFGMFIEGEFTRHALYDHPELGKFCTPNPTFFGQYTRSNRLTVGIDDESGPDTLYQFLKSQGWEQVEIPQNDPDRVARRRMKWHLAPHTDAVGFAAQQRDRLTKGIPLSGFTFSKNVIPELDANGNPNERAGEGFENIAMAMWANVNESQLLNLDGKTDREINKMNYSWTGVSKGRQYPTRGSVASITLAGQTVTIEGKPVVTDGKTFQIAEPRDAQVAQ